MLKNVVVLLVMLASHARYDVFSCYIFSIIILDSHICLGIGFGSFDHKIYMVLDNFL